MEYVDFIDHAKYIFYSLYIFQQLVNNGNEILIRINIAVFRADVSNIYIRRSNIYSYFFYKYIL